VTVVRALTVAGSDSGGGAGIQADLKTFAELDTYGMSVITALTAQNTVGVHGVHEVPADFVRAQLDAVLGDIGADVVKTGMLSSAEIIAAVSDGFVSHGVHRLVVDPVAASKHGDPLLRADAVEALRSLIEMAEITTPNLGEVTLLTGVVVESIDDLRKAAEAMLGLGTTWVLVKGGHLPGSVAVDLLSDGSTTIEITAAHLDTTDTHGTGCTLASAIAAYRGRGLDVIESVRLAKGYVTGAIRAGIRIGSGIGPVDHAWMRHRSDDSGD
jgi:hydroxymethylpyrimidine/phosphomethylpyrimidine kinase